MGEVAASLAPKHTAPVRLYIVLAFALVGLVWVVAGLLSFIIYDAISSARERPPWRRLPSRPGLPPDMEYQTWTAIDSFNAHELSDAVVEAIRALASPTGPFGLATVYGSLKGVRILVYVSGTYPGDECSPAIGNGALTRVKSVAVERDLAGLAHAFAHLVERRAGASNLTHSTWQSQGIDAALAAYAHRYTRKP